MDFNQRISNELFDGSVADSLHVHDSPGVVSGAIDNAHLSGGITEAKMAAATNQTASIGFTIAHADKRVVILAGDGTKISSETTAIVDGTVDGQVLTVIFKAAGTVTIKDNANTFMEGDWLVNSGGDWISFIWIIELSRWNETGRGNSGDRNDNSGLYANGIGGLGNDNTGTYAASCGGVSNASSNDYSATIGGNNCTASGNRSVVVGGDTNLASGFSSVVLAGGSNRASGTNAVAHGNTADATLFGQIAHATVRISVVGDAQSTKVNASKQTTDATITKIWIDGHAGDDELIIGTNRTHGYTITTIARRGDGTTIGHWIHTLVLSNNAGTTARNGLTQLISSIPTSVPGPTFAADNTNDALTLNVQGIAAIINWQMKIDVVETFLAP